MRAFLGGSLRCLCYRLFCPRRTGDFGTALCLFYNFICIFQLNSPLENCVCILSLSHCDTFPPIIDLLLLLFLAKWLILLQLFYIGNGTYEIFIQVFLFPKICTGKVLKYFFHHDVIFGAYPNQGNTELSC